MEIWDLNLRHLAAVAAIARLGSVAAAAQAISLTQPAITQGLAKLERQLGGALFERRPDGMAPLAAGAAFAPRIEAALAHIASRRVTMAQLRALLTLGDAGSYAGASAACGVAPPSLHRTIGDLSVALRRALVERRGRGIALTDAGRRTLRRFRLARAELLGGLAEIDGARGRETGRIVIGAMPLARARLLPEAVGIFLRAHPDVHIAIVEGSHAELIEPLRDGEIDVLIGALRDPSPGDDVEQAALFVDHPVVIGRGGHPLAGASANIEDLAQFDWIVPAPGTPLRAQFARLFDDAGVARPRVPVECGSVIVVRQLLRASDHLTLLSPAQVAVELEAGWLAHIADVPPGLHRVIGTTVRAGWTPTPLQRAFMATLGETAAALNSV